MLHVFRMLCTSGLPFSRQLAVVIKRSLMGFRPSVFAFGILGSLFGKLGSDLGNSSYTKLYSALFAYLAFCGHRLLP